MLKKRERGRRTYFPREEGLQRQDGKKSKILKHHSAAGKRRIHTQEEGKKKATGRRAKNKRDQAYNRGKPRNASTERRNVHKRGVA